MRPFALALLNAGAWASLQMSIAWAITRVPARFFARDLGPLRVHPAEPRLYHRLLRIRRWKRLLPDGEAWVGGDFRKQRPAGRDPAYFRRFALETRRGECAHWIMLLCLPAFFPWNPHWAWGLNGAYALATNLPCIVVQRYNRAAFGRLLATERI